MTGQDRFDCHDVPKVAAFCSAVRGRPLDKGSKAVMRNRDHRRDRMVNAGSQLGTSIVPAAGVAVIARAFPTKAVSWRLPIDHPMIFRGRPAVNAPHLVALVRAGATVIDWKLLERPGEQAV